MYSICTPIAFSQKTLGADPTVEYCSSHRRRRFRRLRIGDFVSVARELDRLNAPLAQVGIQVGGDPEAEEFLRGLDDDLVAVYGVRDIVDTTPYTGEGNFTGEMFFFENQYSYSCYGI